MLTVCFAGRLHLTWLSGVAALLLFGGIVLALV
jgi:hypothetical protein